MKKYLLALLILPVQLWAQAQYQDLSTSAMQMMKSFNPSNSIPGYTSAPIEAAINPNANERELIEKGQIKALDDKTARFIINEERAVHNLHPNENAPEFQFSDSLIEKAEQSIKPGCYKVSVPCQEKVTEKICEERAEYSSVTCTQKLVVSAQHINHPRFRRLLSKNVLSINLSQCDGVLSQYCKPENVMHVSHQCSRVTAKVYFNGQILPVIKMPNCNDLSLVFDRNALMRNRDIPALFWIDIEVSEDGLNEDRFETNHCTIPSAGSCVLDKVNACLESNQTKLIDGAPVTRPCWGDEKTYSCVSSTSSNCGPLIAAHCTNTKSACMASTLNHCDVMSKTFECIDKTCFEDKEVCPESALCVDGSCDKSEIEESDDVNEGVSRLGVLGATSEEVYKTQADSRAKVLFKGEYQECESYILGARNCCTDNGFLELIHCPADMQVLQRAKFDHRVVMLGHYKHHLLGTTRYGHCVFPTRIAEIIQTQGRLQQLHISFGDAENPDCRGVTPEELERIDFKQLDLKEVVEELKNKKLLPESSDIDVLNKKHVNHLFEEKVAYD